MDYCPIMADTDFGVAVIERLLARVGAACAISARPTGLDCLRLWSVDHPSLDRLVHFRILSPPVDTNLMFLFARSDSCVPHFHAQVVQFAPDACVYNADLIPRVDAVEHPAWFAAVYGPITKAYWQATGKRENACASAPGNPAIAVYLSPWSIAAPRPTDRAELERVGPSIDTYLEQCLALADGLDYDGVAPAVLRARDARHLELLHSDELDPRAWKGVYRSIGEEAGRRAKQILATPLHT